RDIQAWEAQPLGPFLAKSFATVVSPWVVTWEALLPYRCAWQRAAPQPLEHLLSARNTREGGLDIELEAWLQTCAMRERGLPPERLSVSNARYGHWTVAQMIAHHTSNGCNLMPGDLIG